MKHQVPEKKKKSLTSFYWIPIKLYIIFITQYIFQPRKEICRLCLTASRIGNMIATWIGAVRKREVFFLMNHRNWVNESKHRPRLRLFKSNDPTKDAARRQTHVTSPGSETSRWKIGSEGKEKKKLTYALFRVRWRNRGNLLQPLLKHDGPENQMTIREESLGSLKLVESNIVIPLYL